MKSTFDRAQPMVSIKHYLTTYFEVFFVLSLLLSMALINYFIAYKVAFLNFYFLPIIVSGYLLGFRRTVLGAFLCILVVVIFALLFPEQFQLGAGSHHLVFHLLIWGCFLVLAGGTVGTLQERLSSEIMAARRANEELKMHREELCQANIGLESYSEDLADQVAKRTAELENSRLGLEIMKAKVEETLHATMDSAVVKLIIEGRLRDDKRKVSVMFVDLVGFTSYSEQHRPEIVIRDLNRFYSMMEPVLLAYNAHIDKYQGDGIMCEFGAPLDFSNYRLLAVVCALQLQKALGEMGMGWQMRVGVASGTAIMGLIGAKRQSYTTIGDVVNLASRFESACAPGSVLIDNCTLNGIHHFVDVRLKHDIPLPLSQEETLRSELVELQEKLQQGGDDADKVELLSQIGFCHRSLMEVDEAIACFKQALQLKPDDVDLKVAYADVAMNREDFNKIKVRGKENRVAAYEVLGLKDVLLDRERLPASFYEKFGHVTEFLDVPEEVILPAEALAGTIGHGKLVALLSYAIASELGISSEQEKKEVLKAGFLADIGMEAVPHHLLNRSSGGLSANEYDDLMCHGTESSRLLQQRGFDSEAMLKIILHSHEKYDGSGRPDGLQGEEIPLGSRIIMVADTYADLTSWRSYRERWAREAALNELQREATKGVLDPRVVAALVAVLD